MSKSKTINVVAITTEALIDYINTHQSSPSDLYELAEFAQLDVKIIQETFTSLTNVYQQTWAKFIDGTIKTLESEPIYAEYSTREKVLAFYFTLFQELNPHRYFVRYSLKRMKKPLSLLNYTSDFQTRFENYMTLLLSEGVSTEEIQARPFIEDKYPEILWKQLWYILNFWLNDNSKGFEKTDAAIEKSVNVAFDLMGYTTFDSMFDFGKFLWNNR